MLTKTKIKRLLKDARQGVALQGGDLVEALEFALKYLPLQGKKRPVSHRPVRYTVPGDSQQGKSKEEEMQENFVRVAKKWAGLR